MEEVRQTGQQSADNLNDKYRMLSRIDSPADLRKLAEDDLPQLCGEIREYLIQNLAVNPGHFASSMGAVELIVALHYVFDTPYDRLVWDVGHQAYAHKLLTGRREAFKTQRTLNGISGFPSPLESEYDTFMAGHASNSISAALGMAIADKLTPGDENRKNVAIIGDASISGGLAFEGINNAANNPNDLLIVLNDNEMSIDDNVGSLHRYLSDMSTSLRYNRWRDKIYRHFRRRGLISDSGKGIILRFNNSLKALISRQQNIFEGLNIRYFGPFDGNDVKKLVKTLREIKDMKGPRLLHIHTVKGKGYKIAEDHPADWHAPGKFNPATGEKIKNNKSAGEKWQDIFGNMLVRLADNDPNIVGVTAAMQSGTSVSKLMAVHPDRTFDVGISEGHAVTFAGGLAVGGKHPFVAIYSAFLQRAYDNIINDIAIQGLPVTFCIDRAGIVGEDGVTHHGMFDLAYLRAIPEMRVAAPMDAATLRNLMFTASGYDGPMAIRYPRGNAPMESKDQQTAQPVELPVGKARAITISDNAETVILSIGESGIDAAKAVKRAEDEGLKLDHYDIIWLKPIDSELLAKISKRYKRVITVENGIKAGGFGSAVAEFFSTLPEAPELRILAIDDKWVNHGSVDELKRICGIDAEGILKEVRSQK